MLSSLNTTVSSTTSSDTTDDSLQDIIHNTSPADEWDVEIDIMDTVVLEQQHGRMQLLMTRLILLMHFVPLDEQMICDIQKIASRLAAKSSQLIGKIQTYIGNSTCCFDTHLGNFTINLAEGYMHIRSKFDGGKQINHS